MAEKLIVVLAGFFIWMVLPAFAQITNVTQCVDMELTDAVLAQFPEQDNSSCHNCLLGFLKGLVQGDYLSFLIPLSDELRAEESGSADLASVSPSAIGEFHDFITDMAFSNHVVYSFSENVADGLVHAVMSIRSQRGTVVRTGKILMNVQQTNGTWRIVEWDAEK